MGILSTFVLLLLVVVPLILVIVALQIASRCYRCVCVIDNNAIIVSNRGNNGGIRFCSVIRSRVDGIMCRSLRICGEFRGTCDTNNIIASVDINLVNGRSSASRRCRTNNSVSRGGRRNCNNDINNVRNKCNVNNRINRRINGDGGSCRHNINKIMCVYVTICGSSMGDI